jgi:copper chaperone CopZ/thiol-disulfide isomerase/thioredoxin
VRGSSAYTGGMGRTRTLGAGVGLFLLLAAPARAERTQVYSIQGADCATCAEDIKKELKKVKGVGKVEFDKHKVEISARLEDGVTDDVVLAAVERAGHGLKAVVGPGQGSYLAFADYPAGADVQTLTRDGAAVGPLDKLRVPDKYTVFDVFAEWCGPCRVVDERLRKVTAERRDVAVRRLDVVDFDSPLARELGSSFETLPYVVVYTPRGKKVAISGTDFDKLDKALRTP